MAMKLASLMTAGAVALAALLPVGASAQSDWPTKPITLICPYAPGGMGDTAARIAAQFISERIGQPVVVENRGGAGGILGTEIVARSAPDGYTFCACGGGA